MNAAVPPDHRLGWGVVAITGLALGVVGWTDLALLWYPSAFGNAEWEFGTISSFLDGLPLGTLGMALFAAGAVASGWRVATRATGLAAAVVTLLLAAAFLLYLLTVPVALRSTPPDMQWAVRKAMLKAAVFATAFTAFYGWLAWFLWRAGRRMGHGRRDRG